jgi:8-oxo-dGTP diphosphatase
MPYTPILATLGYVFDPPRQRVLLVHRTARPGDSHLGKWNGLGGKLEPREDIVAGMTRELFEEAEITATQMQLAGTVSWPGFGRHGEDWFGFLFRVLEFTGTPPRQNPEGTLEWIPLENVMTLNLWGGDRYFLPMVLDLDAPPFHGVLPYRDGEPQSWTVSQLPR